MAKKPISTRARKLIDNTGKHEDLYSLIEETNALITASNDAKVVFRELSKKKPEEKPAIAAAKKDLVAAIKKEDAARKKLTDSEKSLEVRGFVDSKIETLSKELLNDIDRGVAWESSFIKNFSPIMNPLTKTVYSPLNTVTLLSFMKKHGSDTPRFISKSKAKEMFGSESLYVNEDPIPSVRVVSLKKDLLTYSYEKNDDDSYRLDSKGARIKKLDANGDPLIYSKKLYGFSRALVNVEHINSPDVPKEWLDSKLGRSIENDDPFMHSFRNFIAADVSPIPVKVDNGIKCSNYSSNRDAIFTKSSDHFKSSLSELCKISHEIFHATGDRNFETGELLPGKMSRESFVRYNESDKFRAKEEIIVQIAMMNLIGKMNFKNIHEEIYDSIINNERAYNASWGKALIKDVNKEQQLDVMKEHVHEILTESGSAYRVFLDRAVSKIEKRPELLQEVTEKLGKENPITLKIEAKKLADEYKASKLAESKVTNKTNKMV
ncbi:hypothetical protein [Photobacterium kishitanii]|uniref:Polyvalent protein metallopeptidase domain-containing protein n=1 Tax=Photobacterium kishitanii TaxID=318456 RepID=A0A2T3KLG0_9GAMM|nr:hypothetical protein [Photobacterium kishitanii]PSV00542.1 hypothetical protein C9J27_05250 [Photobacterium kishitanii]